MVIAGITGWSYFVLCNTRLKGVVVKGQLCLGKKIKCDYCSIRVRCHCHLGRHVGGKTGAGGEKMTI